MGGAVAAAVKKVTKVAGFETDVARKTVNTSNVQTPAATPAQRSQQASTEVAQAASQTRNRRRRTRPLLSGSALGIQGGGTTMQNTLGPSR